MATDQEPRDNEERGGSELKYSPNDDRSVVKNPTSEAHEADAQNQKDQREQGGQ